MRKILLLFGSVIFSALFMVACQSAQSVASVADATTSKPADTLPDGHDHSSDRISLADAKKEYDAGTVLIVDARAESSYKQERIKGSINLPAEAVETRWKELPKDKKLIVYCS